MVGDGTALTYTYTPDVNFVGTDSFTYRVTDSQGAVASAVITVTVEAVNDPAFGSCSIPAGTPAALAADATAQVTLVTAGYNSRVVHVEMC